MAFISISWIGTASCLIETKLIKYLHNYLQKKWYKFTYYYWVGRLYYGIVVYHWFSFKVILIYHTDFWGDPNWKKKKNKELQ